MSCMSRRDFLALAGYSLFAGSMLPIKTTGLNKAEAISINPLEWIKLIDLSCISCDVEIIGCVDLTKGKVAPRITYWLPQAFVENTKALEFGAAIPVIGAISSLFQPLISALAPFLPQGTYSIYAGTAHQNYMKLYPHWFGFPAVVRQALQTAIMALNTLNPICLACEMLSEFINMILPVAGVMSEIQSRIQPLLDKANQIKDFGGKLSEIQNALQKINDIFPFFPAEIFFFIWHLEQFSPDTRTIAPLFIGLHQMLTQINAPASAYICPHLTKYIGEKFVDLPFGVELSFLCVGRWGYGYPRIGITRHDDPVVASLLGIARFHHLFSKTIPFLTPAFSFSDIKYQLFSPQMSSCFYPGEYFSDPLGNTLVKAESVGSSLLEYIKNPTTAIQQGVNTVKESFASTINSVNPASIMEKAIQQRKVGLVVWHRKSKCCW